MSSHASMDAARSGPTAPYRRLVPVGIAVLLLSTTAYFRVPLLPDIGRDLSMSATRLGLVTSAFALGRMLTDLPAGRLLERIHPSALQATAATVMLAGSLVLAAAGTPALVYVAACMLGVASAVTNATGMHAFSVAVPARRRGTALAVFSTALLGGQAFGPLVAGSLAARSSWRVAEVVAGVICGALAAGLMWSWHRTRGGRAAAARQEPPVTDAGTADAGTADAGTAAGGAVTATAADGAVTATAADGAVTATAADAVAGSDVVVRGALLSVAFAMFFALGAVPQTLIPVIGADELGLGVATIGLALGLGGACRLVGGFVGGLVADRVSRRAALLPGLVLQAGGVALVTGAGAGWWLAGIVVMSLASWSIAVAAAVLADVSPEGRLGPRLGTFRFVGDVGLVAGPLLAGRVYDLAGRVPAMLVVAALLLGAAVWTAVSVPEPQVVR